MAAPEEKARPRQEAGGRRGAPPVPPEEIPDRKYFRIGEVASMLGVRPHVLRYWETEFRGLKPAKSASGQRLYRQQDLLLLYRIRHLLYEERFTIEGARAKLKEAPTGTPSPAAPRPARDRRAGLLKLKEAVEDLLDFVDRHPGPGAKPGERGGG